MLEMAVGTIGLQNMQSSSQITITSILDLTVNFFHNPEALLSPKQQCQTTADSKPNVIIIIIIIIVGVHRQRRSVVSTWNAHDHNALDGRPWTIQRGC